VINRAIRSLFDPHALLIIDPAAARHGSRHRLIEGVLFAALGGGSLLRIALNKPT
jgi:hypothetical protein